MGASQVEILPICSFLDSISRNWGCVSWGGKKTREDERERGMGRVMRTEDTEGLTCPRLQLEANEAQVLIQFCDGLTLAHCPDEHLQIHLQIWLYYSRVFE